MPDFPQDNSGKPFGPLDCGEDQSLFIKSANAYTPATLKIVTAAVTCRCIVDDNGLFIKRVTAVSKKELPEIADLLQGKSLAGRYAKDAFNHAWVSTLSLGLESCRGSLKDAVMRIVNDEYGDIRAEFYARRRKETGLRGTNTILLVDDEDMILHLQSIILKREGDEFNVLTAGNGQEALDILFREEVDLVVLNLMMPMMNGYQVLEFMAKDAEFRKIPVLMSTGISFQGSVYNGATDPFKGMYVEWQDVPFEPKKMIRRIRSMLMEV